MTYSLTPQSERKPLTAGMELRAEWTVHTSPQSGVTARLSNGHLWTLSGDLSKRVSKISALTLAPVKEGAVAQLSNLSTRGGKDRSAAAGLYQERTAGTKAAPIRAPRLAGRADLDEVQPPGRPQPAPARPAATDQRKRERADKSGSTRKGFRYRGRNRNRSGQSRPRKIGSGGAILGLKGGGGSALGGGVRRGPTPPRPANRPAPAVKDQERPPKRLPKRLTAAQLKRVIRPLRPRLLGCLRTHKVKTAVSLRFVISGSSGRVTAVKVAGRASGDVLVRCMLSRASSLRFERFSDATQTSHTIGLRAP